MEKKQRLGIILSTLGVVMILFGVTFSFFNYTRTGISNIITVGRISFNSNQTNTITLLDVFPIDKINVNASNQVGTSTITITGDTTYSDGIEYQLTVSNLTNIVEGKEIPIDVSVSATGIGDSDTNYFDNRGGNSSIYKVINNGTIKNNKQLLVGYITEGTTGVNGEITIKAYLDKDKIAITDTYDGTESDENGTTNDWVNGRLVLTTNEWNSLHSNGVSFQVKVEANEGIWVEEELTGEKMVRNAILAKQIAETNACNPIWVDNMDTPDESDDITYFSGTNDCVDMNYVWYSGKLWRITAIYPDGAMKLVTQNNITSIAFNESARSDATKVNFYNSASDTSYMYQWLNEDFYDTLYNAEEFIDTTKEWNATMLADTNISTKPGNTNLVTANVGLLNSYEYYNSYRNASTSTNYLNIDYYWWLLNPHTASDVWIVNEFGTSGARSPMYSFGGRPSIYLKSGLEFTGSGTTSDPYKIVGDKDIGSTNDLVNTRLSGEYVKLKNGSNEQLFRIIDVEDNKTKLIAMDYADNKETRQFATSTDSDNTLWGSGTTTGADTWYTYLNNTYLPNLKTTYNELFDSGTYYLGTSGYNYKLSVCANATGGSTKDCVKTTQSGTFNIGLPRYGEMFATQQSGGRSNSIDMWLINRYSASTVWRINFDAFGYSNSPTNTFGGRPTLHLKSTVKIISGSGTESDPYVVGL